MNRSERNAVDLPLGTSSTKGTHEAAELEVTHRARMTVSYACTVIPRL